MSSSAQHYVSDAIGRPSLSVVVCAYTLDRWDDLLSSVKSIVPQLTVNDEVIVVIDYNDDLLRSAQSQLATESAPSVAVIANGGKQGLSGARNSGVARAVGAVIAFVDDDAAVEPEWANNLLRHFADPGVAGVGGYAEPVWPHDRPEWIPREFDWIVGCSHVGLPTVQSEVRNFIGCNMAFRAVVFERVGGFSTDLGRIGTRPVGCEETELCIRYTQVYPAARLVLDPEVKVRHRVTDNRTTLRYYVDRSVAEGVSKRYVSNMVGAGDGLSSEREYVVKVLPRAFVRGLAEALTPWPRKGRSASVRRSAAIVLALAATTYGYVYAAAKVALDRRRESVSG